jgi:hypothetical protein
MAESTGIVAQRHFTASWQSSCLLLLFFAFLGLGLGGGWERGG